MTLRSWKIRAPRVLLRSVFQRPHDGRTHAKNRAIVAPRSPDRVRRSLWNLVALGVNLVIFQPFGSNRFKCAEANV